MWGFLIFIALFPPLSAFIWLLAGEGMRAFVGPDFFPVLGLSYLLLAVPTLALGVVEFLTRRWLPGLACSVLIAFVLVPSWMHLGFPRQRFDLTTFLTFGLIGAASAFVSGFVGRLVQAKVTHATSVGENGA